MQDNNLHLSEDEKAEIWNGVVFEMRERAAAAAEKKARRWHIFSFSFSRKFVFAMSAVLLVLVSSAGISYAAQSSLPGDLLYPVKTDVTEKIQTVLAPTPAAKAKVNADITAKRLQEAEDLAAKGKLNEKASAVITQNLVEHAPATVEAPAPGLDVALQKHVEILNKLEDLQQQAEQNVKQEDQNDQKQGQSTNVQNNSDNGLKNHYQNDQSIKKDQTRVQVLQNLKARAERAAQRKDQQENDGRGNGNRNQNDLRRNRK